MAAFNRNKVSKLPGQTIRTMTSADEGLWKSTLAKALENSVNTTPDGPKVLAAFRKEIQKIRAAK
ncbi:MAG: hypothetical protein O3A84_13495 [Proteobacteria bacterium]|nr:hypothetical protein [Pseudomonadota bacterium]